MSNTRHSSNRPPNPDSEPAPSVLDMAEALYSLEIQKHRLLIERLTVQSDAASPSACADYVIRPGRAA